MTDFSDLDKLYEELILERTLEDATMVEFSNFSKNSPIWWNYFGTTFTVPAKWNPKNIQRICYRDREGRFHRTGGPAMINPLYDEEAWYFEGKLHREDNWAYRHKGNFVWFKHGVLHNLHGPAVVDMAGPYQYWIDGIRYPEKQYKWEISRRKRRGKL